MYDIIIVGAGPAGMSAAIYALRANKKVLLLEAKIHGGQIINAAKIKNYPAIGEITGVDFANNLYEQVISMGAEIKYETVLRISEDRKVTTDSNEYQAKSVIIATGAQNRKLNIENEDKLVGKGVSYCATCDGNFYKNKTVAVNGGGHTALEDCEYLSNIVSKVYLVYGKDKFDEEMLANELKNKDNVEFILNSTIIKLNGTDKLESIDVKDQDGNINTIDVDGLFIAIGQEPRNTIFSNVVDLDDKGYIISEDGVHTKVDHIYVAGDTREKMLRQLVTATSDGAIAATMAIREMEN